MKSESVGREHEQFIKKMPREKRLSGQTVRMSTACGNLYVHLTFQDGRLFEVFGVLGKAGACPKCYSEALTRCITLGLRCGIDPKEFVKQLENLYCPYPSIDEGKQIKSCPDAIAQAIKEYGQPTVPPIPGCVVKEESSGRSISARRVPDRT